MITFLVPFPKVFFARHPIKPDCQCNFQLLADEYAPPGPPSLVRKVGFGVSVGLSWDVETSPPPRGFVYSALSNPGRMRSSDIIFPRPNQARRPGNIASNPPVPSLQNLSCLIPLMMDFKSAGRTRKSSEVMQLHVKADSPWAHRAQKRRWRYVGWRVLIQEHHCSTRTFWLNYLCVYRVHLLQYLRNNNNNNIFCIMPCVSVLIQYN